jgi:hypothetical protein
MTDEGYIKFTLRHTLASAPGHALLDRLMRLRDKLYELGLIGVLPGGIGYGNVSIRGHEKNSFLISASATGALFPIQERHFSLVTRFDMDENIVYCRGPRPASSESLSHGAAYSASSALACVLHVHDPLLFECLPAWGAPCTPPGAAFGTPEMARAVQVLARGQEELALVMRGHKDGIIFAAADIERAERLVLRCVSRCASAHKMRIFPKQKRDA